MTMIFPVCLSLEQSAGARVRVQVPYWGAVRAECEGGGRWQNLLEDAGFGRMGERCFYRYHTVLEEKENADLCSSV